MTYAHFNQVTFYKLTTLISAHFSFLTTLSWLIWHSLELYQIKSLYLRLSMASLWTTIYPSVAHRLFDVYSWIAFLKAVSNDNIQDWEAGRSLGFH